MLSPERAYRGIMRPPGLESWLHRSTHQSCQPSHGTCPLWVLVSLSVTRDGNSTYISHRVCRMMKYGNIRWTTRNCGSLAVDLKKGQFPMVQPSTCEVFRTMSLAHSTFSVNARYPVLGVTLLYASLRFPMQQVWGRAWAFVFLVSSLVMLMPQGWGLHFENNGAGGESSVWKDQEEYK